MDPAEVNKSNSPQSDESIRSSAVLMEPGQKRSRWIQAAEREKKEEKKMTVLTLRKTAPKKRTTPA